jgi:hypothetical protein
MQLLFFRTNVYLLTNYSLMSSMEPDVQEFLKKVVQSVFAGLFWLMLNMTLGIYFGFLFIKNGLSIPNLIFYSVFFVSLIILIMFYYRTWSKRFPHG